MHVCKIEKSHQKIISFENSSKLKKLICIQNSLHLHFGLLSFNFSLLTFSFHCMWYWTFALLHFSLHKYKPSTHSSRIIIRKFPIICLLFFIDFCYYVLEFRIEKFNSICLADIGGVGCEIFLGVGPIDFCLEQIGNICL